MSGEQGLAAYRKRLASWPGPGKSPLRWKGGKFLLARSICQLMPVHKCYCEVFGGAAWVLFRKKPSPLEVLNDRDGELMNFWRVIKNHYREFLRQFGYVVWGREEFARLKCLDPAAMTDIQRAARFFYLNAAAFGGDMNKPIYGYAVNEDTPRPPRWIRYGLEEVMARAHERIRNVSLERLDWADLIRRYDRPSTLFYIDPPYFGYERDYTCREFRREDFGDLARTLAQIRGKFIMSINDAPEIRRAFAAFLPLEVETTYTICNRKAFRKRELVLRNFDPDPEAPDPLLQPHP